MGRSELVAEPRPVEVNALTTGEDKLVGTPRSPSTLVKPLVKSDSRSVPHEPIPLVKNDSRLPNDPMPEAEFVVDWAAAAVSAEIPPSLVLGAGVCWGSMTAFCDVTA